MTLEELVGRQLVVGLPGTSLTPDLADHLRAIHAGGFIPFERNFTAPDQFRALVAQIGQALGRVPLVMVDQEGGRVTRFRRGVTQFPDALEMARRRPSDVLLQGVKEGQELRALGVQVNLAPCLDVLVEGADPVIGTRSYGSDHRRVAALGISRIQGLQQNGVAACAKHFPGIGAVTKDPHRELPTVALDWAVMNAIHLPPFADAVQLAGVATVMSSHVCYPGLGLPEGLPATFSPWLVRRFLREEMKFDGVVLSDDLEMGALRRLCPIGEAAVRAAEAGHDVVLVCSDLSAQREVFEALRGAYRGGRLSTEALEESVARIQRLMARCAAKEFYR
ncbi:MAG: beta-N-acetylhexosaminidase [Candidatus Omnitrophica bacterium]|nr:beta-N-acetylhexosaminidase [Candidatus Omnitrophota bacterium]